MKKTLFILFTIAFTGIATAQVKTIKSAPPAVSPQLNNFEKWSLDLKLSEAQIAQVQAINENYESKKTALRSTGTQTDFQNLEIQKQKEIDAVLTEDQIRINRVLKEKKEEENLRKAKIKSAR